MRGASWQSRLAYALVFSPLLLSQLIPRTEGSARSAVVAVCAAFLIVGGPLAVYGWRLDRSALKRREAGKFQAADDRTTRK